MADSLLDLLEAGSGIVCAVGAGGKKSVLNLLVASHPGRTALTASVGTTRFPPLPGLEVVVEGDERVLADRIRSAPDDASVAYARPIDKPGRLGGVSPEFIERMHAEGRFAATYVKADGARMRWIKAPADGEPVIPPACTTLVGVVSARAIGEPLEERVAHRLEELSRVTGLVRGERISADHVGRLIAHPEGLMKGAGGGAVVAVINMVDDGAREVLARRAAETALDLAPRLDRVVLARLNRPEAPVVAVIRR